MLTQIGSDFNATQSYEPLSRMWIKFTENHLYFIYLFISHVVFTNIVLRAPVSGHFFASFLAIRSSDWTNKLPD